MSTPRDSSDEPSTEAEFNDALSRLMINAYRNDVDVTGGWDVRNETNFPDWGVEVYIVQNR